MSTFEAEGYQWRETYFVLFQSTNRPSLKAITKAFQALSGQFEIANPLGNAQGEFESLTLRSPLDHAAIDISFLSGEEVLEHRSSFTEELRQPGLSFDEKQTLQQLQQCDVRFDILHFEQVENGLLTSEDDEEEMLDPGALLAVIDTLAELTSGIGIDPQSGTFM